MKTLCIAILLLCNILAYGQLSFGLKVGLTPNVNPQTAHCIINRDMPQSEFLFNIQRVRYTPVTGVFARLDKAPYWFSAELLTYGWKDQYTVQYTQSVRSEANGTFFDEKRVLEMPLSIGITLGRLEIFSGFTPLRVLSEKTELDQIKGYSTTESKFRLGWHSRIGINLDHFLVDLRYTQFFANYGQHRSVNGWDLTLMNARAKLLVSVAFRF